MEIVIGSWGSYNACNERALGSSWLDFADYDSWEEIEEELKKQLSAKDEMNAKHSTFFDKIKDVSDRIANIDKELVTLESNREKLTERLEARNNYMWEEYELTHHNALSLRDEALDDFFIRFNCYRNILPYVLSKWLNVCSD